MATIGCIIEKLGKDHGRVVRFSLSRPTVALVGPYQFVRVDYDHSVGSVMLGAEVERVSIGDWVRVGDFE